MYLINFDTARRLADDKHDRLTAEAAGHGRARRARRRFHPAVPGRPAA
ncbi:MAG: hypothetical protein ABW328_18870 [Ilumatobacteraceae bacterium]